ncbi:YerC/YecD family TrpR-related protein [Patescibacteria group bacterium]
MQVSKSRLKKEVKKRIFNTFYQAVGDIKNSKEAQLFVSDFLTEMEKITLAKRLMVAYLLEKGKSYEFIKKEIRVSSATIASVDKMMGKKSRGFALVLKKIEADQWASNTAKKVSKFVENIVGK